MDYLVFIAIFAMLANVASANGDSSLAECPHYVYPVHDVRNCLLQEQSSSGGTVRARRLEVLPGHGFDNLRNLVMGQVHFYNYSTCKVTEDGKYMIPDSVFVVPLQEGHYKFFADYYDHWDNYTSIVNSKVNIKFDGLFKISGKFAPEMQSVKENQVNYNSKTTRVTFRNGVYGVHLDPASELHPKFKSKIYEISAAVQNNNTALSRYLSEILVRDYGTHFITSAVAGAVFVQLHSVSVTYARNKEKTTVTSSASVSFPLFQVFGFNFSLGYDRNITQEDIEQYQTNLTRSEIFTIGGAAFTPSLDLTQWLADIPNRLATIDRRAIPIHFTATPTHFPELPILTIRAVSDYLLEATDLYYRINTRPGCIDPSARNFDFQANFGDSTYCDTTFSQVDSIFGGIYQTCYHSPGARENLCADRKISQVNPQTGDFTCPTGYTAVSLYSGTESYTGTYTMDYETCTFVFFCSTSSRFVTGMTTAYYETFWCVVLNTPQQNRGYLFGGYFTPTDTNLATGTQSCPPYYHALKIAVDISICVSNDYELGYSHTIGFAGFHSCMVGNPLSIPTRNISKFPSTADWPRNCPAGYSQHLVAVQDGCEINVCLEKGAFQSKSLLPPRIPPFQTKPQHMPYPTEKLTVQGSDGGILVRNTAGQWRWFSRDSDEAISYYKLLQNITSPGTTDPGSPSQNVTTNPGTSPLRADNDSKTESSQFHNEWPVYLSLAISTVAIASVILLVVVLLTTKCRQHTRKKAVDNCSNEDDHQSNEVPLLPQ